MKAREQLSREYTRAPGPDPSGVKPFSSTCVPCSLKMPSVFYVTLPAVWLVLVEQIIKRGKLVVSGGVTRGRVARGATVAIWPRLRHSPHEAVPNSAAEEFGHPLSTAH